MVVYEIIFFDIFQVNLRNKEIVYQHNIAEKLNKISHSPDPRLYDGRLVTKPAIYNPQNYVQIFQKLKMLVSVLDLLKEILH